MRKILLPILLIPLFAASAFAQNADFVSSAEKRNRQQQLKRLAQNLLREEDSHKRLKIRLEMVKKDVIRSEHGMSVPAFKMLWVEGKTAEDINARLHAVLGLSELKAKAAQDPLVKILRGDDSEAVQLCAIQAVQQKAIKTAGSDVAMKLRSPNTEVVIAAARCVAALGFDDGHAATGQMIRIMASRLTSLQTIPKDHPTRPESQRLIEVMGRQCAVLVPGLSWAPTAGADMAQLVKQVEKFTGWWNKNHVAKLGHRDYAVRKQALVSIRMTAGKNEFKAVFTATKAEAEKLKQGNATERQNALDFIALASNILHRVSNRGNVLDTSSDIRIIYRTLRQWENWNPAEN